MIENINKNHSAMDSRITTLFDTEQGERLSSATKNTAEVSPKARHRGWGQVLHWITILGIIGVAVVFASVGQRTETSPALQTKIKALIMPFVNQTSEPKSVKPTSVDLNSENVMEPTTSTQSLPKATTIVFSGYIVVLNPVAASLRTEGMVTEVFADEGNHVEAGQVLARLDSKNATFAVEEAHLTLERAKTRVETARVAADKAQSSLKRARALSTQQVLSTAGLEEAGFAYETAVLAVTQAEFDVRQFALDLARQENLLSDHQVIAPISGVISERNLYRGAWLRPGEYPVCGTICSAFVIVDPSQLQVEGEITESRLHSVRLGDDVSFHSIADPTLKGVGRITRISPSITREKATLKVIITISPADFVGFSPNMAVKITTMFSTEERSQ